MSRRWLMIAGLLCPACASGSGPLPPEDLLTIPKSAAPEDTGDASASPPASGVEGSGGAAASSAPNPTAPGSGTASGSLPAPSGSGGSTPAPGSASSAPPASAPHLDCQALWAVVDTLGCALVTLVCGALEDIDSSGAQVPCDVAVPLACGISSAAATAAEALCPR
jgi:hypothetical protein